MEEPFDVFTVRNLRLRKGDLLRDAEEGKLASITKYGRHAFLAIPFGERLLEQGIIHRAMARDLFEAGHTTFAQAAKLGSPW